MNLLPILFSPFLAEESRAERINHRLSLSFFPHSPSCFLLPLIISCGGSHFLFMPLPCSCNATAGLEMESRADERKWDWDGGALVLGFLSFSLSSKVRSWVKALNFHRPTFPYQPQLPCHYLPWISSWSRPSFLSLVPFLLHIKANISYPTSYLIFILAPEAVPHPTLDVSLISRFLSSPSSSFMEGEIINII